HICYVLFLNINAESHGMDALLLAAWFGNLNILKMLVEKGSDRKSTNQEGMNMLHCAAQNNHSLIVEYIIKDLQLDLNKPIEVFSSQLHCSCWQEGNTALHLAARNGHSTMVEVLLSDWKQVDEKNEVSSTVAVLRSKICVFMLFFPSNILSLQQGKTPLGVAARGNHIIIVDMIIKAERYFAWKEVSLVKAFYPLSFKPDRTTQTNQLRTAMWNLANHHLKPKDWKKLAFHWNFTEEQIKAIGEQWTGTKSYKEHGHRTLLIWLHGILLTGTNPVKGLYEALISIEQKLLKALHRKYCKVN
uniref:Ankyrin repeat and death domain containing 1B n=1 Tax=Callorhinchus milii TaxID=7868 RepID=A0A4W3GER6_CALMI